MTIEKTLSGQHSLGPASKPRKPSNRSAIAKQLGRVAFILGAGLLMAVVLIQAQGYQAIPTILSGLEYAVGSPQSIARTLAWGLPLFVATMGVAIAYRSGMFNIGAEGQIYAGAMAAALVGAYIGPMFTGLHLLLCIAASAAIGALVAAGLGWLRAAWNVDEVLSTLLSNYIIILFCAYLVTAPLRDPSRQSGSTVPVHDTAMFSEILPKTQLTTAVFLVVVLCAVTWWISEKSVIGYKWRMTGESPDFAAAVGINVRRARIGSMALSGALCGIAGALLVTTSQGRFWTEIGTSIGWDAVLLAMIARARPVSAMIWVAVYCVMRSAARGIEQVSTVPSEISLILIAGIIIAASARAGIFAQLAKARNAYTRSRGKN